MSRPGETAEGITVPEGDPDALRTAGRQLDGVAAQLEGSSGQLSGLPSLMSGWAGPASSAFAQTTGQEAASIRQAAASVALAALQVGINADALEDAQHKAERAIRRAERARDEIKEARADIREAERAQADAKQRMELARLARAAAEQQMLATVVDAVAGGGAAAAAAQVADAQYREAERDLEAAIEREGRARRRLAAAEEDMRDARELGREAAKNAEDAALLMQGVLLTLPERDAGDAGRSRLRSRGGRGEHPAPTGSRRAAQRARAAGGLARLDEVVVQGRPRHGDGDRRDGRPRRVGGRESR